MPKATCTLVGIISLPVEHGSPTSKAGTKGTDDQHLTDTLTRLVGKTPIAADRLRPVSRLSAQARRSLLPQQTVMVRANVEQLESQLFEQTQVALAQIATARI